MKISEITQQQRQQIVDLYSIRGYGIAKIKRELRLSLSVDKIKKILREEGITLRNFNEANLNHKK